VQAKRAESATHKIALSRNDKLNEEVNCKFPITTLYKSVSTSISLVSHKIIVIWNKVIVLHDISTQGQERTIGMQHLEGKIVYHLRLLQLTTKVGYLVRR